MKASIIKVCVVALVFVISIAAKTNLLLPSMVDTETLRGGSVLPHNMNSKGQSGWTMIDYGDVCGQSSSPYATDINNQDQVSGWCYSFEHPGYDAFVWTLESGLTDIGFGQANAINDDGQVVGGNGHAFLWTQTDGIMDLGTLGGGYSGALGINNNGQVVGYSRTSSGEYHAFLWSAEKGMIDLGTLGGNESTALGINDRGQVVGSSRIATGEERAFIWTSKSGMINLGSFGGESRAYDINNKGVVIGYSVDSGTHTFPFRWSKAHGMESLGLLGDNTFAYGINDSGEIVGEGYPPLPSEIHAFFWSQRNGFVDLDGQSNFYSVALKINSQETIVGNYQGHFVLWVRQR